MLWYVIKKPDLQAAAFKVCRYILSYGTASVCLAGHHLEVSPGEAVPQIGTPEECTNSCL